MKSLGVVNFGSEPHSVEVREIERPTPGPEDGEVSNRRVRWRVSDDSQGLPDGLCMDAQDGLWVAFWNGGVMRHFDKDFNLTQTLEVGVPMPTSAAFVGKDLGTLLITSAHDGVANPGKDWGKTFSYRPKVGGLAPVLFPIK